MLSSHPLACGRKKVNTGFVFGKKYSFRFGEVGGTSVRQVHAHLSC